MSYKIVCIALAYLVMAVNIVSAESANPSTFRYGVCGDMRHQYGPFDYTNYDDYTTKLPVVEINHFTYQVESLEKGLSGSILGDLSYTVLSFPNHHRALNAMAQFEFVVENAGEQIEENLPIDCYFQYAINYKPRDGLVRLIYGTYLHKKGMHERDKQLLNNAELQYNAALDLMPNSADVHYNLGLFYLDVNNLSLATSHGHKAYQLGFPLQGLKDKLKKKGVWDKTVSQY